MDDKEKGISMAETRITISSVENPRGKLETETSKGVLSEDQEAGITSCQSIPNSPLKSMTLSCPSPENSRAGRSPNKPPRVPSTNENLLRKRSLAGSVFSRSKSRFGEVPIDPNVVLEGKAKGLTLEDHIAMPSYSFNRDSLNRGSPDHFHRTNSLAPKTPVAGLGSPGRAANMDEDEENDIIKKVEMVKEKNRMIKPKLVIEWVVFICLSGCLVASLTVDKMQNTRLWDLELWNWFLLAMVIFCGLFVTHWVMHFIVFLIEKNFLLRKKVLYFVHGLKKSVQIFIWIALVLLSWGLLFKHGLDRFKNTSKFLDYVTRTLLALLVGSFLWLLKTLLLKILAMNFHVNRFFDRIQESVFHQYILQTLSGPPLLEGAEMVGRSQSATQMSFRRNKKSNGAIVTKVIDIGKVHEMKKEKVSTWTMKVLVDAVTNSGLYTISNVLDESANDREVEHGDREITNEMEAIAAAIQILRNVAHDDDNYIDEVELSRFMIKEEIDLVFQLFEASETRMIDKKALTQWMVKVFNSRKALAHALNDTKTAVKQLNKLVAVVVIVATFIIWLLLMEIATTKVLVVLSSQLVVAAFIFGNTCKTIFEAIIFVFVMHPFDVGDRCVIDGVQLLVEEMNILTTVFLKLNNEKVYYPNSILATKPISNYYRSPDMGDRIDFSIDFATPAQKIGLLKETVKTYIEMNSQYWHPTHSILVLEIEGISKINMALMCNHTMNYQEFGLRNKRRGELVMELKRIFEELEIKYSLLPQDIRVTRMVTELTS